MTESIASIKTLTVEDDVKTEMQERNERTTNLKQLYQEFVKIMLKVKFEKIHNSHTGQAIPEKILFKECMQQNIPKNKWHEFIVNEFKNTSKYVKYMKNNKSYKNLVSSK